MLPSAADLREVIAASIAGGTAAAAAREAADNASAPPAARRAPRVRMGFQPYQPPAPSAGSVASKVG